MINNGTGLVLSGGGAKGAYQVGLIKAINEEGIQIAAISGASIGSINSAVIASSDDLTQAEKRLRELWQYLENESPVSADFPEILTFLALLGFQLKSFGLLKTILKTIISLPIKSSSFISGSVIQKFLSLDPALMQDKPLFKLMDKYIDIEKISDKLPFFVSVFPSHGGFADLMGYFAAHIGFMENRKSEFIHIQSLKKEERKSAILASAAIPLLYSAKTVGGRLYSDGGVGKPANSQGNTPVTPLYESGYERIIVSHLADASLWSRDDFPTATILEIRPESDIERDGMLKDMLGFGNKKISSWIEQGYRDAKRCIKGVSEPLKAINILSCTENLMDESSKKAEEAMEKTRQIRAKTK